MTSCHTWIQWWMFCLTGEVHFCYKPVPFSTNRSSRIYHIKHNGQNSVTLFGT